ncbi:MAG: hypothetical protein PHP22_02545 [Oscillospiraceae bacterium]|nr:hypothetical protein [Oscillospiraceae bacterium]
MSSMIQTALAFPIAFLFSAGILVAAPAMYSKTNNAALLRYEYQYEQSLNKKIYSTGAIQVNDASADTIYTSPERMQYLISSLTDSVELIAKGVKEIC